jgi:hypothetical protein
MSLTRALSFRLGTTASLSLAGLAALACAGCVQWRVGGGIVERNSLGLDALPITVYYEGQTALPTHSTVQARHVSGWSRFRLLNQIIAYRDDHKVVVEFQLPSSTPIAVAKIYVRAYNDDPSYSRAVRFELDGQGGYLGTLGAADSPHRVDGSGVLGPKAVAEWVYELSELPVGHTLSEGVGAGGSRSLFDLLRSSGPHKIVTWVSTYEQYDPASWITLDLVLSGDDHDGAGGPRAGYGSCVSHPVR